MYSIHDIAGFCFSCSLVFYVEVVSIVLYADNPVTSSPLQVPFSRLLVFREYSVTTLKSGGVQFVVFCVCLNLFSSKVFLAMASARGVILGLGIQNQCH